MSKVIDEKVVQMRFDNAQFEKNVSTSMSTLDKLKKSLNLDGAAKGLESVNAAAKNFDISGLSNGVETVKAKFSALQVMAVTALGNITNTAVNAGKRLVAAFTIDPIKTGFEEYETQINAVQTILANTQSKGSTLEDVNKALDELNHYADMTIYNFTEMTRNIGTFTAAGVDLDTSVSAIKGIANLAAVSGSTSLQASTAMYQLSQALAAGKVQLMDWNSVVNAGMGGQVFQDALKETARVHGVNIDQMIKEEGSFRETLKYGWLTSKVLTETLSKFTGDLSAEQLKSMGYSEKQVEEIMKLGKTANDAATKVKTFTQLMDTLKEAAQSGWTQTWEILIGDFEEAKALLTEVSDYFSEVIGKSANARNDMLQSWKDMGGRTMLIDSVKNIFEGLLSILEPIKEAFREIFPPITAKQLLAATERIKELTSKFKLNDAQAAKLKATFKGLFSVVKLGVNVITKIVGGVATLVGKLFGFSGTLLDITGSLGDFVSKIAASITSANLFGKAIDKIVGFLGKAIDKTKEFTSAVTTKIKASSYETFLKVLNKIWEVLGKIGKFAAKIGKGIATGILAIGRGLVDAFENGNIESLMGIVNSGILASILLSIRKFVKGFKDFKDLFKDKDGKGGIKDSIVDVLNGVKDSLEAWQNSIKAGTILKIAAAIGILAVSLLVISKIPTEKLGSSLGSITILFAEMMGAIAIFDKIGGEYSGAFKAVALMIGISAALLILASGLKKLSSLSWGELAKGLTGVLGLMTIIVGAMRILSTNSKQIIKGAGQMVAIALALKILVSVCKDLSAFNWNELAKGVSGVGILMAEIAAFLKLTQHSKQAVSSAIGIVIIASAMKIMASACKDFAQFNWVDLAKGAAALGGILVMVAAFDIVAGKSHKLIKTATSLVIIGAAMKIFASVAKDFAQLNWVELGKAGAAFGGILVMVAAFDIIAGKSKNLLKSAISLVIVGAALEILQNVLKKMGNVSWEEYGKQMAVLGGSLLILSVALIAMKGTLPGAAALLIATGALMVLTGVLKILGGMSWGSIIKGLVSIAGVFLILGAAGYLLGPVVPVILSLSGAVALFGLGCLAAGVGIVALSAGLASLAAVTVQAAAAIVATLHILIVGFLELIPSIIKALTDAVVALCEVITRSAPAIGKAVKALVLTLVDVIVECVPAIADGALKLIVGVLGALVEYTPKIVDLLYQFFIGIIDALGRNVPKLIQAFVNMLGSIFSGAIKSLGDINIDVLLKGVACVGFLTAIALGLAALAAVAPLSMIGVLALGAIITELSVVLAAVGVLAQMPGLKWLIYEGADLLYAIGNAIGQFVGGIVGGVAEGASRSLPNIANNLSTFMTNLQPFLDGASKINASTFEGVMELTKVILALTAVDILDGIASWVTGGSSLTKFAEQLVPFGEAMTKFSSIISGNIDEGAITAAANAGKVLTEMANTIPNSGGIVSWFSGDNDLSKFSEKLVSFGEAITEFSETVSGNIDEGAVSSASNAGRVMAEMVQAIPKAKGLFNRDMSSFVSQLKKFGKGISEFSASISGDNAIDGDAVKAAADAGKLMAELNSTLPKTSGVVSFFTGQQNMASFGKQIKAFGKAIAKFSDTVSGKINKTAVESAVNIGKTMVELSNTLPKTGGVVQFFTGKQNMESFGKQIKSFGKAISEFSASISGDNAIDGDAVKAAADAGKIMSEMNSTLPKTGGVVQFFTGQQSMANFGNQLASFGKAISAFSKSITGENAIDEEAITAAANAGRTMSEMNSTLPKTGGVISFFSGQNNMAIFGNQLASFGKAISAFSKSITGDNAIDNDAITAAANAGKLMAELASVLPEVGGFLSQIVGGQNLDTFGEQLEKFGKGIVNFSKQISEEGAIDENAIESAAGVGTKLAATAAALPNLKDKDLGEFGKQLKAFGKGITNFSKEVSEDGAINPLYIFVAATVGKWLAETASALPDLKDKNLGAFGKQLKAFGKGITNFSKEVSEEGAIDPQAMSSAAKVGTELAKTASELPNLEDKDLGTFGKQLKAFGKGITNFSKQVSGDGAIDPNAIISVAGVGKKLAETASSLPNIGDKNLGTFGTQLKSFGEGIASFSKQIAGIDSKTLSANIDGIKAVIAKMSEVSTAGLDNFVDSFSKAETKSLSSITKMLNSSVSKIDKYKSKFSSSGKDLIKEFIKGLKTDSDKVSEPFTKALTNATTSLRTYYTSFRNAGSYLAQGFADGISANTYKAEAKSKAMAEAAANAARKALNINSPSKVFRAIAYSIPEGFAQGIDRKSWIVEDSAVSMAEAAVNNTKNVISRIADSINSDVDTQPTIRPVLDLSDVSAGADSINGMFSMNPSVGVMSNVRSISSMMNNQNRVNDDVVSAIESLGKKMNNSSSNVYSFGDVVYDDGSNVSDAVKSLVRAIRVERRT